MIVIEMNYRTLGKTGLKVSEIGSGAWAIGKSAWIGASDKESLKALHRAIDLGLEAIDVQQFHVWSDEWVRQGDWLDAIQKLKKQGKVRYLFCRR
jgi:aryl-alcohol dehydrogenase-like predicted oxidoreductase